jgi:hypothetical protein
LVNPLSLQTLKKKKKNRIKTQREKKKKKKERAQISVKEKENYHLTNKTTLACMQSVLSCTGLDIYSSLGIWASSSSSIGVGNGP